MVVRFILLIGLAAATLPWYNSEVETRSKKSFAVDYEHDQFLLDGKPFQYISGSIHYFRIHREQWKDRLKKVRSLGFNAIQYYIPWNFHENFEGQYDFSGMRDFVNFTQLAYKQGLYSLVRIGPYVCGEWENGGLPWWLLKKSKTIKQRSNDEIFKQYVTKWFDVLLPMLKPLIRNNGGPVIMVQIENEYGSYDACDRNYTIWLRDLVKKYLGNETVLYTTDGNSERFLKCGYIPGVLPTVDFGVGTGQEINQSFIEQKKYLPNGKGPLVNSEFYPGWLVLWGQKTQSLPGGTAIAAAANWMYKLGASINFYMIHGGTNFGFWNGAETNAPCITSYDYSAPITEAGDVTMNFNIIRLWIKQLKDWKWKPTAIPPNSKKSAFGKIQFIPVELARRLFNQKEGKCIESEKPLSFEDMDQPMGFVTYSKKISNCSSSSNLTIPLIKDYGYVFINRHLQGTFVHRFNNLSVNTITLKDCVPGIELGILVENQGRQTYETINDYKGILSDVYLDNEILTEWTTCQTDLPYEINNNNEDTGEDVKLVDDKSGMFYGEFTVEEVTDTFIDTTGWGKGIIFINEFNIGRYWASQGPQYTLYVPYPILKKGINRITIIELEQIKKECIDDIDGCWIESVDEPQFIFEETKFINSMNERKQLTGNEY